mgnify:CR=1 FL=1
MEENSLLAALGAGLAGQGQAVGFWALKGRESKAA